MVILEGPDRAGKSTLAEVIASANMSQVRHLPGSQRFGPNGAILVRHWDRVLTEMRKSADTDKNIVYDRMVLGSLIYAFKNDSHNVRPVTPVEYSQWISWLAETKSLLICAMPPLNVLLERMKVGEAYITQDDMISVQRRYADIFQGFKEKPQPFDVLFYNSSVTTADEFYQAHRATIRRALGK